MKYKRPMGTTIQAMNLRYVREDQTLYKREKIQYIRYVIKQYINQGYRLNQTNISLEELAHMLDVRVEVLIKEIGKGANMWFNVKDREKLQDGLGMMVMKLVEASVRDRAEVEDNLGSLKKALVGPGGERVPYKAFVSGEFNKALMVNLASQKALLDTTNMLIKLAGMDTIKASPTINITNHNEANQNSQTNYLTTEKAIELLVEEKGHVLLPEGQGALLEAEYIDDTVPNVNPLTQVGYGSDKSNVGLKKKADRNEHEDRVDRYVEIV